jgi:hypothetical protein
MGEIFGNFRKNLSGREIICQLLSNNCRRDELLANSCVIIASVGIVPASECKNSTVAEK